MDDLEKAELILEINSLRNLIYSLPETRETRAAKDLIDRRRNERRRTDNDDE